LSIPVSVKNFKINSYNQEIIKKMIYRKLNILLESQVCNTYDHMENIKQGSISFGSISNIVGVSDQMYKLIMPQKSPFG
jgi:hypothetical protein